jgi:hypothetical protein
MTNLIIICYGNRLLNNAKRHIAKSKLYLISLISNVEVEGVGGTEILISFF